MSPRVTPVVLAFKIQRASDKLQKWDHMATKLTEISETKKQQARERELSIQSKLEKAQKSKQDYLTFQKTQTMERLEKWQNRHTRIRISKSSVRGCDARMASTR